MTTMAKPKLPIDITGRAFQKDKYEYFKWMREHAPVCPARISVLRFTALSRYDDCVALTRDERFVRNRTTATGGGRFPFPLPKGLALLSASMITEDEPNHGRLRRLVNQAFKPAAIAKMEGQVEELTSRLLDQIEKRGTVDLLQEYAVPIPSGVIRLLMGMREQDMPRFQGTMRYLTQGFTGWRILRTVIWDLPSTVTFMREVIERKRAEPEDDILSDLIHAEEEGDRLNQDELLAMAFLLIVAGYETTSHLIVNAVLELLQHPDQLERLRADPELLSSAIEEVQRFRGPVQASKPYFALEDVEWHEVTIKKGSMVMPLFAAGNHDPSQFENPETFDIGRSPNHHLGFGHGIHFCLGAQLARLETRVALARLFERNPNLRLAVPPEDLKLSRLPGWHRYESLPVTLR